jgi:mannose-6-phosphate isomerase-like protein (cupin superfamily)
MFFSTVFHFNVPGHEALGRIKIAPEAGDGNPVCICHTQNGRTKEMHFNEINKPQFPNDKGAIVTEYSGLASDKEENESWAVVAYEPGAGGAPHYHSGLTEVFCITMGDANIKLNGDSHRVKAGMSICVGPDVIHEVENASKDKPMTLIVLCIPAWTYDDFNVVNPKDLEAAISSRQAKEMSNAA